MQKLLGCEIGLRFRAIYFGAKENTEQEPTQAIHLELPKNTADVIETKLQEYYSSTSTIHSAGKNETHNRIFLFVEHGLSKESEILS